MNFSGISTRFYEHFMERIFTPSVLDTHFPRSKTYAIVNELERGSCFVTSSLNAISSSLIDSGYPLNYCVGSVGIVLDHGNRLTTESEYKERESRISQRYQNHEPFVSEFKSYDDSVEKTQSDLKAKFVFVHKNSSSPAKKGHGTVGVLAEGRFSLKQLLAAQAKSKQNVGSFFEHVKSEVSTKFM